MVFLPSASAPDLFISLGAQTLNAQGKNPSFQVTHTPTRARTLPNGLVRAHSHARVQTYTHRHMCVLTHTHSTPPGTCTDMCTHICALTDVRNGARIPLAASGSSGAVPEVFRAPHLPGLPICHSAPALSYSCQENVAFNNSFGILPFLLGAAAAGRLVHTQTFLPSCLSLVVSFLPTSGLVYTLG